MYKEPVQRKSKSQYYSMYQRHRILKIFASPFRIIINLKIIIRGNSGHSFRERYYACVTVYIRDRNLRALPLPLTENRLTSPRAFTNEIESAGRNKRQVQKVQRWRKNIRADSRNRLGAVGGKCRNLPTALRPRRERSPPRERRNDEKGGFYADREISLALSCFLLAPRAEAARSRMFAVPYGSAQFPRRRGGI